jgi:hypothetical protein
MNRLQQKAPLTAEFNGVCFNLKTSFRRALKSLAALADHQLTDAEKQGILVYNLFGDIEEYSPEMLEYTVWYLKGGKEERHHDKSEIPTFDFNIDAQRIYEAFLKKGIDLDAVNLHWWTFLAHFAELPECALTRIMHLRNQNNTGKLSKHEREECARIGWDIIKIDPHKDEKLERLKKLRAGGK